VFNVAGTECTWDGVYCDSGGAHVVDLDMNCLTGSIASLTAFTELEDFNSGGCWSVDQPYALSGPIPDLSGLKSLRIFFAGGNRLTGPMPSFSGLVALQTFDVSFNDITGQIPDLSELISLQQFDVSYNRLSGPIPSLISLPSLQGFDARYNELSGSIPALPATLGGLAVNSNNLSGGIPDLEGLANLDGFQAAHNLLSGPIPPLPPRLRLLDLSYNQLAGNLPALSGTALRYFFIQGNHLSGRLPTPPGSLNYCNNQDPICEAAICPNSFDTADAHEWDTVLGVTPWWATPFNNNKCDDIFAQGFGN
jgi:hypothetical protein